MPRNNFIIPKSVDPVVGRATLALSELKDVDPIQIEAQADPLVTPDGYRWLALPIDDGLEVLLRPLTVAEAANAGTASPAFLVGDVRQRPQAAAAAD